MKKIVIYPGRFQPFGPHHYKSYVQLCNEFGNDNVYVVTSNKTSPDSPWTFDEKVKLMKKFGIPEKYIIMEKNPYKPEFLNNFDTDQTQLVVAYGSKDDGRFSLVKKDGSPAYYQPLSDNLETMNLHGYLYKLPHVNMKHNDNELSGTYIRKFLKTCTRAEFTELFGFFDSNIYDDLKKKIVVNLLENILNKNIHSDEIYELTQHLMNSSDTIQIIESVINNTKSLGIDRINMPQIIDVSNFINWLHGRVDYKYKMCQVKYLKFVQKHIDMNKVRRIIDKKQFRPTHPIIISKDYYILDGHHRVAAAKVLKPEFKINCLFVNLRITELLRLCKKYPGTKYLNITELKKNK